MKLSIITINRNDAEGLHKTIKSIVGQTFTDYEYIVIDGASTDNSVDIIKKYENKISYWVSEPDKGIYNAMNKGIKAARGEYLFFLNAGDWFYSDKVLENVFALNRNEDFLYGNVCFIKDKDNFYITDYPEKISFLLFYMDGICHQAVFHKRSLFEDKLYDENLIIYSDYEFFIQKMIIENKSTFFVNEVISNYDENGLSSSTDLALIEKYDRERKQILSSFFPERVLNDYALLANYEDESKILFVKRMRRIMKNPRLYSFTRKIVKVISSI